MRKKSFRDDQDCTYEETKDGFFPYKCTHSSDTKMPKYLVVNYHNHIDTF